MDENYYGEEPTTVDRTNEPSKEDGIGEEGKTFLLNKSICPDCKPGEELVVKVERVLESELEVSYAPKKKEHSEPSADADSGESEMSSMFA